MSKLTQADVDVIRSSSRTARELAVEFGTSRDYVKHVRAGRAHTRRMVANEPFRRAVEQAQERDGLSLSEIAYRAGWRQSRAAPHCGDSTYLQRLVGLRGSPAFVRDGVVYGPYPPRGEMTHEAAVKLCDALGLDYADVGL